MYLDSSTLPFPAAYTPNMRPMKAHWSRRSILDEVPDQHSRMMHLWRHIRFITPDYMYLDSSTMPFPAAYTPNMRPMKAHWSRRSILDGVPDQYSRTAALMTLIAPYSIHNSWVHVSRQLHHAIPGSIHAHDLHVCCREWDVIAPSRCMIPGAASRTWRYDSSHNGYASIFTLYLAMNTNTPPRPVSFHQVHDLHVCCREWDDCARSYETNMYRFSVDSFFDYCCGYMSQLANDSVEWHKDAVNIVHTLVFFANKYR